MKKIRLLTPGPTPVPERLSLRMARPIVHHRSPEFEAVFARVREGLSWLFQTKQDVLVFAASGTGAMEASFVNFLRKGDTAVVVDGGKFGERWVQMPRTFGLNAIEIRLRWGEALKVEQLRDALRSHPGTKAVYLTQSEAIPGWREALKLMPVGSTWQLFVPSELAYGARGLRGKRGSLRTIGANETLVYDVELLSVETAPAPAGQTVASIPAVAPVRK